MKRRLVLLVILLLIVGGGVAASGPIRAYWQRRNRPEFNTAKVTRGNILEVVNATGTIKPILEVTIGPVVSGPIQTLYVDFNDEVVADQVLAKIDPRIYEAAVASDMAALATARADVERVGALLNQALNNEQRALALRAENEDFISDTEMDQFKFNRMSLEAQKIVAEAAIARAQANLENSQVNLKYTDIVSPVDGIVVARKIDEGQTLAAQFQTPEMFIVAPKLYETVHIHASVGEADMGKIIKAKEEQRSVQFTVVAYLGELFGGTIEEIRISSTELQNVVTYPVIVSASNEHRKLLPGMTAQLSFDIDKAEGVLRIPNAALRFYPEQEHVRPQDRKLLLGAWSRDSEDDDNAYEVTPSAQQRIEAAERSRRRHVWVRDGELLKAIEVLTGLSDNKFTEIVEGDLEEAQPLVTGLKVKT